MRRVPEMLKDIASVVASAVIVAAAVPHLISDDALAVFRGNLAKPADKPVLIREGFEDYRASGTTADMNETVHRVPVTVPLWNGEYRSGEMIVTAYKPEGLGPFPAIIHHHGTDPQKRAHPKRFRQFWYAKHWVSRGFAVFAVTRLGFGDTGLEPFPELIRGPCTDPNFTTAYDALADQSEAALRYLRRLPHVNDRQILLSGQSRGGSTVIAHIGRGDDGVIGGINFAGSYQYNEARNRHEECGRANVHALNSAFGRKARAPTLWIFGEDDTTSPVDIAEDRYQAFRRGGGEGMFQVIAKQSDLNGHYVITRPRLWAADVDRFVRSVGIALPRTEVAGRNR
ncbi:MAG: hypothetical protein AAFV45_07255 [Pseudomonadota bacterium]